MFVLEYCSFTRVSSFIAFYLFTESFVSLVLLLLPIYVHHSLAYKYPSGVLPGLLVATLLVVLPNSLGLVRSVSLYPLTIFVINFFLSQLLSPFLLSEYF
jgi:hypothetical protein